MRARSMRGTSLRLRQLSMSTGVVMGRACSMKTCEPAKAHSMSWGWPKLSSTRSARVVSVSTCAASRHSSERSATGTSSSTVRAARSSSAPGSPSAVGSPSVTGRSTTRVSLSPMTRSRGPRVALSMRMVSGDTRPSATEVPSP
jgi:hypothetical protein